jgi:hypothetical protein
MRGSVSGIRTGKRENIIPGPIRRIGFSRSLASKKILF